MSLSTTCWGAEESLLTLACHAGLPVRVVAPEGELLDRARSLGLIVRELTDPRVRQCGEIGASVGAAAVPRVLLQAAVALVSDDLWDHGPTVSFSQWLHLPLALAGRRRRRVVVVDLHEGPFTAAGAAIQCLAAFTANRCVATSRTALEHVKRWPRNRVRIVPRPVSLPPGQSWGHPKDSNGGAGASGLRLVIVGRLDPEKGLNVALEAVDLLRRAGVGATLEVVGSTHRAGATAPDPAKWPGAVFHGRLTHDQTLEVMASVDLLLSTAKGEAFGRTVAEAAMLGVPSVVVGGGPAELVHPEETGWVVPPDNPQALAELLSRLAKEPAMVRSVGAAVRSDVQRRCDPDLVAAAWVQAVLVG